MRKVSQQQNERSEYIFGGGRSDGQLFPDGSHELKRSGSLRTEPPGQEAASGGLTCLESPLCSAGGSITAPEILHLKGATQGSRRREDSEGLLAPI